MREDTGDEPASCPWRVFVDPYVVDVLEAARLIESGLLAMLLGTDPPAAVFLGAVHYTTVAARIRAAQDARKKPQKPR